MGGLGGGTQPHSHTQLAPQAASAVGGGRAGVGETPPGSGLDVGARSGAPRLRCECGAPAVCCGVRCCVVFVLKQAERNREGHPRRRRAPARSQPAAKAPQLRVEAAASLPEGPPPAPWLAPDMCTPLILLASWPPYVGCCAGTPRTPPPRLRRRSPAMATAFGQAMATAFGQADVFFDGCDFLSGVPCMAGELELEMHKLVEATHTRCVRCAQHGRLGHASPLSPSSGAALGRHMPVWPGLAARRLQCRAVQFGRAARVLQPASSDTNSRPPQRPRPAAQTTQGRCPQGLRTGQPGVRPQQPQHHGRGLFGAGRLPGRRGARGAG